LYEDPHAFKEVDEHVIMLPNFFVKGFKRGFLKRIDVADIGILGVIPNIAIRRVLEMSIDYRVA
jgi:hypothetical protein